jgi:hypothetical protein
MTIKINLHGAFATRMLRAGEWFEYRFFPIDHSDGAVRVILLPVLRHLSVIRPDMLLGAVGIDGGIINPG